MDGSSRPMTDHDRGEMRRWLDTWQRAGAALDEERWRRVASLTDEQAWEETVGLLAMWESTWTGDAGEGLLAHQDVFGRARHRRAR
jgi:hypothetical protein